MGTTIQHREKDEETSPPMLIERNQIVPTY
jgi:hypothetical protein